VIRFSVIIPVFNRPEELNELLQSLAEQTCRTFEVIIVENGSEISSKPVFQQFTGRLRINYYDKPNSGPGDSRNYGCLKATTDFFVFFDSDCIIPNTYFEHLEQKMQAQEIDAFGGPDRALPSFTPVQKAINFSMTSMLTTGGIRGKKRSLEHFHPRSFNMGISKQVFEATGGFSQMRFGEDIDLSLRIHQAGFKVALLEHCYVFHKRRTDFRKFFRQVFNSGIARINLSKKHPKSLKLVHVFPGAFTMYLVFGSAIAIYTNNLFVLLPLLIYWLLLVANALVDTGNVKVALLALVASHIQLIAYGLGFLKGFWRRVLLGQNEFHDFKKNFYR